MNEDGGAGGGSLRDELERRRAALRDRLGSDAERVIGDAMERARLLQIEENMVAVGEVFPDFALADADGRLHASEALLDRGPLVVAFFRGGFCPFCRATLVAYDRLVEPVADLGGTIVGILPERTEVLAETRATCGVRMPLLSDERGALARMVDVQFPMPAELVALYEQLGTNLADRNAGAGWTLPVPAVFLVAPDGNVIASFADADSTRRAEPEAVLDALASAGR
ncbi:MAG: peroxiredoxin-like family protein [Pseudomonadota bacterium]